MKNDTFVIKSACIVCHRKAVHYDFSLGKFRIEECKNCGLMRLNPQPADLDLVHLRDRRETLLCDGVETLPNAKRLLSLTADHHLDALKAYAGGSLRGNILLIGSNNDELRVRAARRGLIVTSICDFNDTTLSDSAGVREKFDFVFFADRLEHERNPRAFLRNVHRLLRDHGVIMAIVTSLDSVTAKLMKSAWPEFRPERLWYFSSATLSQLLYGEDFGAVKISPDRRTLNLDYVVNRFNFYSLPRIPKTLVQFAHAISPRFLRQLPFRAALSDVALIAMRQRVSRKKSLSVVMPVFNEANTVRGAIDRVLAKTIDGVDIELLVVESNSTDGTREIVHEYESRDRVKVILQDRARGKGNAVRAGLEHVCGDFVLIQDADDEYDIEDYDMLLEPLITGEAAFVLGARHGGGAWKMRQFNKAPLVSHIWNFGHWFFVALVNIVYRLELKDPYTMYKVFRADCLRGLEFECDRFDFDLELLIKLVRKGYIPTEIPVNYRSRSLQEGKKVDAFRDPWTWLRAIFKYRFQEL